MKSQDEINQIIKLRSKNLSYDKISKKLNISKPKIIEITKKFQCEINNLKAIHFEQILEEYGLLHHQQLKLYSKIHDKVSKEILSRDLSCLEMPELLKLLERSSNKIEKINSPNSLRFVSDEDILERRSGTYSVKWEA